MLSDRSQPEWMDLKSLQRHADVCERTLREWIHRPENPLPASQVGGKFLVRRTVFDRWLEAQQIRPLDIGCMVDDIVSSLAGSK
jgi:excisionase family DNA binding protein